ncbi:hypothetical protein ACFSTH_10055 [Paenibacillus yanchengensis]|uniref:DUF4179 domain-containing protein n=1 Tax=Paenibacillus yanchengensis TaxID=2035833 RepID=A0ABW4YPC2_9BACL
MDAKEYWQHYSRRIHRHLALPCLLIACLVLAFLLHKTFAASKDFPISINHLSGDASTLEQVEINGTTSDSYHRNQFIWDGEKIDVTTTVFDQIQPRTLFAERIGNEYVTRTISNDAPYTILGTALGNEFTIEWMEAYDKNSAVPVQATIRIPTLPTTSSASFANPVDYGVTKLGNSVYFTLPTSTQYIGTNGIYKLVANEVPVSFNKQRDTFDQPIVALDLQVNEDKEHTAFTILGLETIGDHLLLLAHRSDQLILQRYSIAGQLVQEAIIADVPLANPTTDSSDGFAATYEIYNNNQLNQVILQFYNESTDEKLFVTIQHQEQLTIENITRISLQQEDVYEAPIQVAEEDNVHLMPDTRHALYYNDRLYYVTLVYSDATNVITSPTFAPVHIQLFVYEVNELTYTGKVVSDLNSDLQGLATTIGKQQKTRLNDRFLRRYSDIRIQIK